MKKQKLGLLLLEIFGVVLFLLFLSPIFLLVINSAKSSAEILASPLSWPASFGQLWTNAVTIWNNPSIKYPSSFFASTIITVISLVTITLFSALAAWGLVRYRSKLSTVVFFSDLLHLRSFNGNSFPSSYVSISNLVQNFK